MPNYRRSRIAGASYFFTVVTHRRRPWLCEVRARNALRAAIRRQRRAHPFQIDAFVLLPDHLHCIWTLPQDDEDYSVRWQLIKASVTRALQCSDPLWQRRFWEHTLRNERDFAAHCAYVHYNPVKHGLCTAPLRWPYSSVHRFVREGTYPADWGAGPTPRLPENTGGE